ncbi:LLM class flavin-dependent oxidoreductase [Pyxidicoccus fallax]|uniref:LLM class flavin-dependent oxidoreductase n=1 Tax=Pyxidicoccus fallax TaxID=394095 RepID=A0A848LRE9_9BACT|nr:MupA/Atu3671 family FMN-dependent luciferase-like monooxygenase [Pyxidicoccus fallax]NMO20133.1 LLM class flavin-dependent oxidoreductase [Pyxidicoccus fallax]NPC80851.1 LLM class flavin-dependent oxidoreductase [Pyxidicoccus fallax]
MTERHEKAASDFTTLVDLLCFRAERQGDALLYRFLETGDVDGPVEEWSYTRLDTRARALGALLRELGAAGERALLLYPPGMEFVAGFMGCLYGGVVAVPCYPPDPTRLERTLPRLRAIAQDCGAKYVLTTSFIVEMSEMFKPQAPELGELVWLASDAVPEGRAADWKRPELDARSLAFLQYTSGSTGNPKGVMVSHSNILHNEALITRGFGLDASRSSGMGWLPMFHDMGLIGKVLQPMYLGFPCTLMSPIAFLQRPLRWLEAISHFKATCSGGPNFAYDLCVRKATDEDRARLDLSSWDLAFNGAEPVRRETLERFAEAFAPSGFKATAFYPCYGLAEATLIVTGGTKGQPFVHGTFDAEALERGKATGAEDGRARTLVGSGVSAPDQRMLIVHPETRVPCTAHEVGEIWVSGPSVAQGYWSRPEETAHAFGAKLASGEGPYLRTGDLGFVSPAGELFVTGRLKDLLIIRGRNLYPQDLELSAERAHRAVRAGCCAAFSVEVEGEERLVLAAEVDMRDGFDAATVVEAVRRALAEEHAVHAHGVVLIQARSIPKTSSGKIQRRATRAAYLAGELEVVEASVVEASAEAAAASGAETAESGVPLKEQLATASESERAGLMEAFLRRAVARVLRLDAAKLSADTDLAGLGLDSLMVLELHGKLESELGLSLPAAFLWQNPTLGSAAAHLVEAWKGVRPVSALVAPAIVAGAPDAEAPLSSGQLRLWFLDRLVPQSALYNIHFQLHLSGPLDEAALRRSLDALVARHPVLRATFPEAGGQPRVAVSPIAPLELPKSDLRALAPEAREAHLRELSLAQAREAFRLGEGPLVRAALVALADQEHVLLMTQHHITTDGWSIGVLARELAALYRMAVAGESPTLPAPALHYADFARWQQGLGALLDGQRAYWAQKLAGLPRLELPTDFPRPKEAAFQGALHRLTLPRPLVEELRAMGRREGCTLFVTLAAAWTALLHRYSGQEDFGVGTVVAHRERPELRDVVGFFAHTLVLRGDVAGQPSFRELLSRTRRAFHEALAHTDLPFEEVVAAARVARGGADNPLFQTSLLLEALPPTDMNVPGMAWKPVLPVPDGAVEGTAKFDLQLSLVETPDGLSGALEYRTDLFSPSTMARLAGHLETLLRAVVDAPEARVEDLPLLTSEETRRLLVDWNDSTSPQPEDAALCIHAQFRAQAARTPDAVAVAGDDETLSYAELDRRSDALAWRLRELGVGPEVRVGLCVERSARMVVAMLGVLKAGGAYVPLDPDYPRERLAYMLEDSGAAVLLTESHLDGSVPAGRARTLLLDGPEAAGAAEHDGPPASGTGTANLAYVIYTSGSTGKPKGVMVPHGGVANFFTAMDARVGHQPAGSWLAVTSISFDISVLELLWTLTRGFKVVVQGEGALLKAPARVAAARHKPAEFSLFYFADDADDGGGDRYRLLLEGAKFADRNGFAAVWTPERHFHAFGGLYPNPSVAGAAIASVTERVGIRAGSVVLPLHHPVRVAEEWSLVDNLSRGRVGISVASGWHANDFVFAPERYEKRRELMMEGLDTIRRLWRGETLRMPGGAGTQVDVKLRPKPIQAELPVWLTAAGNPETFIGAGKLGCRVLTHLLGQTWEDLEKKLALYREAWRAAGHPGDGHVTLMLHTFIGEDAGKVRAVVEKPFRNYLKSSADLMRGLAGTLGLDMNSAAFTEADLDRLAGHAFERYFETSGLFGTPRSVREQVEKLKAAGVDEVGCLIDFGIPADTVLASLPLLNEVKARSDRDSRRSGAARPIPLNLREHVVTHLQCTPSLARALLAEPESTEALGNLRRLMVGGEALPTPLATSLRGALPEGGELLNMYGPTETTIWSSTHAVRQETGPVASIGTPFSRTQFYVVDAKLRPMPVGVPGELYIGGEGVVRGYLSRPALTAERFVPDPFSRVPGARLYRTGDRARWRDDGTVEFLGRVDYQLKVRGFRIEAGEIEAALASQPAVREAVVVAREDEPGDVRLVAYVVARDGQPVDATALRDALAQRLPEHMVPSLLVELPALPLTPNGKVDRKALPVPTAARASRAAYVAPQSQLEQQIAEVWRRVLKVEQVGVNDNFFDLGGHSLLMVQVHTQLKAALGQDLPLLKLLEHPTISALARHLRQEPSSGAAPVEAAQDRAKKQLESLKRQQQRARKQG